MPPPLAPSTRPPKSAMPPPLALLAALLPLAALAFTPGNLIVSLVGDGTVAGSAGGELNNQSLVVLTFEEFAVVNGSVLASTGQIRTVPSPEASQQGEPPFTTLGNAADPGGSNKSPQSGSLALSADGFYLTFVGYTCAAGTFVGTSNSGTGDVQTANTITHVSSSCTRLIAYIDATGLVRVVDGDLNSISVFTYPANNYYTQDVWSAVYCASCGGFYVTTGPIFNNGATGGIWFVPSPSIAGTLGAGIRLAATTQDISTGGKSNFGGYTTVGIFNGAFYVEANAEGVCGGLSYFGLGAPGLPTSPTQLAATFIIGTKNPTQGALALSPVVGNGVNCVSNTALGSHLPRAFVFTDNAAVRTLWQTDANYGLMAVPQCTFPGTFGKTILCSGNTSSAPLGPNGECYLLTPHTQTRTQARAP